MDEESTTIVRSAIPSSASGSIASRQAGDYVRFVFANEPCERLRGFGDRVRTALLYDLAPGLARRLTVPGSA